MILPLRDDGPRLRLPAVTLGIVFANLFIWVLQVGLNPPARLLLIRAAGAVPWEIAHLRDLVGPGQPAALVPPPLTLYTSMFMHGDALHLAGNVWFLWVFGARLEEWLGHARFALFYLLAGTAAGIIQVAAGPDVTMPMIGASGAIAGVLGAYALHFPRARVRCLLFLLFFVSLVTLPAAVLLALWLLAQLIASGRVAGVAWYAHLGGFVAGIALSRMVAPRRC